VSQSRKSESIWVGTVEIGKIRFIAMGPDEPKSSSSVAAHLPFTLVRIQDLGDLYRIAKETVLGAQGSGSRIE